MAINKIFDGGESQDNPIEAAKRKVFLIGTPAGILSVLAMWAIGLKQNDLPVSIVFLLPILAFTFSILVILLWTRLIRLRVFEIALYVTITAYVFFDFAAILVTITFVNGLFSSSFTLWLPLLYLLTFLILKTKRALMLSSFYFLTMLTLGSVYCVYFQMSGRTIPNLTLLLQVYLASGFYIAVLYLVARLKEYYISEGGAADDMSKLAMTDSLTHVDNRRMLSQLLQDEVARADRHNLPLAVLLFDLDHFKDINDSFGHNTGDEVLQEVATQLRQTIRTSDPFGRWGGDEFLCLATNTDGKQAIELAERLREALQKCRFNKVEKVTASFGITAYQKGDSPETLIRRADMGLYKAKAGGRNRVEAVIAGITLPLFEGEKPYPRILDKKVEDE